MILIFQSHLKEFFSLTEEIQPQLVKIFFHIKSYKFIFTAKNILFELMISRLDLILSLKNFISIIYLEKLAPKYVAAIVKIIVAIIYELAINILVLSIFIV